MPRRLASPRDSVPSFPMVKCRPSSGVSASFLRSGRPWPQLPRRVSVLASTQHSASSNVQRSPPRSAEITFVSSLHGNSSVPHATRRFAGPTATASPFRLQSNVSNAMGFCVSCEYGSAGVLSSPPIFTGLLRPDGSLSLPALSPPRSGNSFCVPHKTDDGRYLPHFLIRLTFLVCSSMGTAEPHQVLHPRFSVAFF